jgi:hypothetical protein
MEEVCSSKTLITIYETTQRHDAEGQSLNIPGCKALISHTETLRLAYVQV